MFIVEKDFQNSMQEMGIKKIRELWPDWNTWACKVEWKAAVIKACFPGLDPPVLAVENYTSIIWGKTIRKNRRYAKQKMVLKVKDCPVKMSNCLSWDVFVDKKDQLAMLKEFF